MAEQKCLENLRQLREMSGITQSEMAKFFGFSGHSARNRMRAWETGDEIPPIKHREIFIRYLTENLNLQDDVERFDELWNGLCDRWNWLALSPSERKRYLERDHKALTRKLIYELPTDEGELRRQLDAWMQRGVDTDNGIVVLQGIDGGAAGRIPTKELVDFGVECDVIIPKCGADPWVGLIIRGVDTTMGMQRVSHIDFGYLVYLRANGLLELYCRGDVEVASRKPTEDATANWTKLKIEVVGSQISIYANGNPYIVKHDTTFGGRGYIYLQAYQATASIKNIKIYEIS